MAQSDMRNKKRLMSSVVFSLMLITPSISLSILPEYDKRPDGTVKLRAARRNLELSETMARRVGDIMITKNFSLLIDFTLEEQTRGTLFSVYGGSDKAFEIYAEGLRGELRVHWRRHSSLANLHVKHLLDDNQWHTIILSMVQYKLRLFIDCEEVVAGDYPEIDFTLLNTSKPQIWIGQRTKTQSYFQGSFRRFDIEPTTDLVRRYCGRVPQSDRPVTVVQLVDATSPKPIHVSSNGSDSPTIEELKTKVRTLEKAFYEWVSSVFPTQPETATKGSLDGGGERSALSTPPLPKTATDGVCPNCYEYLRYKINHLEDELRMSRATIKKLEKDMQHVVLAQRGCQINSSTVVYDGFQWTNKENCTECVCHLGKSICKPTGCPQLPSSCTSQRPHLKPDQCCPTCGRSCTYLGATFEHGRVFWPKECLRCQCVDGDAFCAHRTDACPQLSCAIENQYKHENQCCPVCENDDFCSAHPCHANATCTNQKADRDCKCKPGFFGDGDQCFDVDECKWDASIAEQLGGCGLGSRCINTPGSFHCECLPGYTKYNNRTCLDMIIL